MAVGNQEKAQFFSIFNGKICQTFKTSSPGSIPRTNKLGNVVHEKFYDYISGQIVSIDIREHKDYGKSWLIGLLDGEEMQYLQMHYSSGYSQAFLKLLPNVDLQSQVKIVPDLKTEGTKKKSSLFILQHGKGVKWFYTKDNKNGLPDLAKVRVKGKDQWDDSDQMEFLEDMVKTGILPNLPKRSERPVAEPQNTDVEDAEPIEDAPF